MQFVYNIIQRNTYVNNTDKEGDEFNNKADSCQHNPYQQVVQSLYKINTSLIKKNCFGLVLFIFI